LAVSDVLAVRLSPDHMHLEVRFTGEAHGTPRAQIVATILEECVRLGVTTPPTSKDISTFLSTGRPGEWAVLHKGTQPGPPVDGRIELLVPVSVAGARQVQARREAVEAGTILARRIPGTPGTPGCDLQGQPILPRAPKEPRLPRGPNTLAGEGGTSLVAACTGEVVLRNLQVEIVPAIKHAGDIIASLEFVNHTLPIFIEGSVLEGSRVETDGEIYVAGDVVEAELVSRSSNARVAGNLSGSAQRPCTVQAAGDVTLNQARLARVSAGADIRVQARAWQCTLLAKGDIYLAGTIGRSLIDVQVDVEGAIVPQIEPENKVQADDLPRERQFVRVPCRLPALWALHGSPPLQFHRCTLYDISVGGTKFVLEARDGRLLPGAFIQVKFILPDGGGQLVAIARVARTDKHGVVGLRLIQVSQRDLTRLTTYCHQLMLRRSTGMLTSPEQRGQG